MEYTIAKGLMEFANDHQVIVEVSAEKKSVGFVQQYTPDYVVLCVNSDMKVYELIHYNDIRMITFGVDSPNA